MLSIHSRRDCGFAISKAKAFRPNHATTKLPLKLQEKRIVREGHVKLLG
jgi:hypothetical protein